MEKRVYIEGCTEKFAKSIVDVWNNHCKAAGKDVKFVAVGRVFADTCTTKQMVDGTKTGHLISQLLFVPRVKITTKDVNDLAARMGSATTSTPKGVVFLDEVPEGLTVDGVAVPTAAHTGQAGGAAKPAEKKKRKRGSATKKS